MLKVPVEHGGVAQQRDVQPPAPPLPPRRHAELLPVALQELAHLVRVEVELGDKGTDADPRCVGLDQ